MNDFDEAAAPPVRAYQRVEAAMRARIATGDWPVGAMLPSRRRLAQEYAVSLATLERAVATLIAAGELVADDRRGTFVARPAKAAAVIGEQKPDTQDALPTAPPRMPEAAEAGTGAAEQERAPTYPDGEQSSTGMPATLGIVALWSYAPDSAEISDLWIRAILFSIERTFSERGGATRFFNRVRPDGSLAPMEQAIISLLQEGVDALVIVDVYDEPHLLEDVLDVIDKARVPLVYIGARDIEPPIPHVFYDNRYAGYQAAHHLLRNGWRDLTFFAPYTAVWTEERIQGAQDALRREGMLPAALRVFPAERSVRPEVAEQRGQVHTDAFRLAQSIMGRGIIAANDYAATEILQAAAAAGKTAGVDYALIGFDDAVASRALGLTSLRPPLEALGAEAARLLLSALRYEATSIQIRLRSHLMTRASTRPFAGS